jgi:hypothetical protein
MKRRHPDIVSASDIASWSFCPESWRLTELGHRPTNQRSLDQGESYHLEVTAAERSSGRSRRVGLILLVIAVLVLALALIGALLR